MAPPILYDFVLGSLEALGLWRWRRSVIRRARGRVLEIGAGTGRNLRYYGALDRLTVTDPSAAMLDRARMRAPRPGWGR
jgi:ubiquinone/menaquinone biosynthesis C-methylase UbiE